MSNKIIIRAEKKAEPRLTIQYEGNILVVNEPDENLKNKMIEDMMKSIVESKDFDEKKMLLDLIDHCTNVEFDKNVLEVVHLSHEAKMITNEILLIFQEIIEEAYQLMKVILQQTKNDLLQEEILEEKNKIMKKAEEEKVEEVREERIEEEKVAKRKPQRRRKK
jgi:hypothetical protein